MQTRWRITASDGTTVTGGPFWTDCTISNLTLNIAAVPPAAPTAYAASQVTTASFLATWTSVSGATGYRVDLASDMAFTQFPTGFNNTNVGNTTGFTFNTLQAGKTYYFRVRAFNAQGTSLSSNIVAVLISKGTPILDPVDTILAVDWNGDSACPAGERAPQVIDRNIFTKYLNFGRINAGFIVTPAAPGQTDKSSIVRLLEITTANDFSDRDPMTYALFGTNDAIRSPNNSDGLAENWTLISDGALPTPQGRRSTFTVNVTNNAIFRSYKWVATSVRNPGVADCVQLSEIQFYGEFKHVPAPRLSVENDIDSPTYIGIGTAVLGQPKQRVITLRNHGDANLNVNFQDTSADAFTVMPMGAVVITPNQSATFTITFNPQTIGTHSGFMQVVSNDPDPANNPWIINLQDTCVLPRPALHVYGNGAWLSNGANTVDFGVVDEGKPEVRNLSFYNGGNTDLIWTDIEIDGEHADEYDIIAGRSGRLAPEEWAIVKVEFAPVDHGAGDWLELAAHNVRPARLRIRSNDPYDDPFDIRLSGAARIISPRISVTGLNGNFVDEFGSGVVFPGLPIGRRDSRVITITNHPLATADLEFTLAPHGEHVTDFTIGQPGLTKLKPGESTSVRIDFHPAAPVAPTKREMWLTIHTNETHPDLTGHLNNPFDLHIAGYATPGAPEISVSQVPGLENQTLSGQIVDFGSLAVGESRTRTFTVTNIGTLPLELKSWRRLGDNAGDFQIGFSPKTLAADAKTTFTITYKPNPPAAAGARNARFELISTDADENPFILNLTGGVAAPELTVFSEGNSLTTPATPLDLGIVNTGTSTSKAFTLTNTGDAELSGLAIIREGPHAAEFVVKGLTKNTLSPGASASITVTFTPKAGGPRSAVLHLISNDADENPFDIPVTGLGFGAEAASLTVEWPAGTAHPFTEAAVELRTLEYGKSQDLTVFRLRNLSGVILTGLTAKLIGPHAGDFTITGKPPATLSAGAGADLALRFTPKGSGRRTAVLQVTSADLRGPFLITLSADVSSGPAVLYTPSNILALMGEEVLFGVHVPNLSATFRWQKNGAALSRQFGNGLRFAPVKLTDAGTYALHITDAGVVSMSPPVEVGVIDGTYRRLIHPVASTATLEMKAAGNDLSLQWLRNGAPLVPNARISGVNSAKLVLRNLLSTDAGTYACRITGPSRVDMESPVTRDVDLYDLAVISSPPQLPSTVTLPVGVVSGRYFADLFSDLRATDGAPATFTVKGLPAGVGYDSRTGIIVGRPTAAKAATYSVVITAVNAFGQATTTGQLVVESLPAGLAGTYSGLVERHGIVGLGLGGSLSLIVSESGVCTGKVLLAGVSHSIIGQLETTRGLSTASMEIRLDKRGSSGPWSLRLAFNGTSGEVTGSITSFDSQDAAAPVQAWRSRSGEGFVGGYTAALDLDPSLHATHPGIPLGNGFVMLSVAKSGACTWSGSLADGATVTGASSLGLSSQVPLHLMLYTPATPTTAGSAQGWSQIRADDPETPLNNGLPVWDGALGWLKRPQASSRSYRAGFGLHPLTLIGGKYAAPASGAILGLMDEGVGVHNARLRFAEGGLPAALTQDLRISATNGVIFPPSSQNPAAVSLTLKADTGLLGGGFTLKDRDPADLIEPYTFIQRKVKWSGVLVPRLNRGVGCCQIPQLPDAAASPPTTSTTSPILSGQAILESAP
ncbi:MAG: choice-of-anchor D domain-containing protein [Verrucomicrobiota bacterium]